jgi:hypothetical protein
MYIDKWWGNVVAGDNDDSMLLIDYFKMKNKPVYLINETLKDFQLENLLGKKPLYESSGIECFFWMDERHHYHADIDIPINLIIDLSALLLQSLTEKSVKFENEDIEFSITADNNEIKMLITELEQAVREPHLYYPDFLQDDFSEIKDGIMEICNELKSYLA